MQLIIQERVHRRELVAYKVTKRERWLPLAGEDWWGEKGGAIEKGEGEVRRKSCIILDLHKSVCRITHMHTLIDPPMAKCV